MTTIQKIEKCLLSLMHNYQDELYLYLNPSHKDQETVKEAIFYDYKDNWVSSAEKQNAMDKDQMWQLLIMNDSNPQKRNTQLSMFSCSLSSLLKTNIVFENKELEQGLRTIEDRLLSCIDKLFGSVNIAYYPIDATHNEPKGWNIDVYVNPYHGYSINKPTLEEALNQIIPLVEKEYKLKF